MFASPRSPVCPIEPQIDETLYKRCVQIKAGGLDIYETPPPFIDVSEREAIMVAIMAEHAYMLDRLAVISHGLARHGKPQRLTADNLATWVIRTSLTPHGVAYEAAVSQGYVWDTRTEAIDYAATERHYRRVLLWKLIPEAAFVRVASFVAPELSLLVQDFLLFRLGAERQQDGLYRSGSIRSI